MRVLTCQHRDGRALCGMPFARIERGCLVIEARHRGEIHTCTVAITDLLHEALVEQAQVIEAQGVEIKKVWAEYDEATREEHGGGGSC